MCCHRGPRSQGRDTRTCTTNPDLPVTMKAPLYSVLSLLFCPNPYPRLLVGLLFSRFTWTGCADTPGELPAACPHARPLTARPASHGAPCTDTDTDTDMVSGGTDGPAVTVLRSRPAGSGPAVITACALLETRACGQRRAAKSRTGLCTNTVRAAGLGGEASPLRAEAEVGGTQIGCVGGFLLVRPKQGKPPGRRLQRKCCNVPQAVFFFC